MYLEERTAVCHKISFGKIHHVHIWGFLSDMFIYNQRLKQDNWKGENSFHKETRPNFFWKAPL